MTREETYQKWQKEKDTIRQIIGLHALDTLCGNNRDDLNYVDGLYPLVEGLFGVDICIESLGDKDLLRSYYEENYDSSKMSYDELNSLFNKSRNVYEEGKEKAKESNIDFYEKSLNVMKEIIDVVSNKVYSTKKTKTM
ncbi:MAG: hypothetical protein ACLUD7_02800 [Lachnospiraceae bacterium]